MAVKKKAKKPVKKTKKAEKEIKASPEKPSQNESKSDNPKQTYEELIAKLPDKMGRFVQEYLVDLNKQKAAERAGYSKKSSAQQAFVLMKNPIVVAAITEGKRLIAERTMVNQDEVIKELARIGFVNMADFYKKDKVGDVETTKLIDITDLKRDLSAVVMAIEEDTVEVGGSVVKRKRKFKLHDKVKALLGILDRVKPGADDPKTLEVTLTNMPPEFKSIQDWEKSYQNMTKKAKDK
ncbi:MAG: terminase small subunit [Candidatus Omnitrophota bacterium]|jgi:phage terminase small subunit